MQKVHIWEKVEIELKAANDYDDPYNDVDVFVDLKGPNFNKRCYGFWDGGNKFQVRIVATAPGTWTWKSGSNQNDDGLNNITETFEAMDWSEEEKQENPARHGFVKATGNGHALQYEDGTPYYLLGDTWWATGTDRFKWYDDENPRPLNEEMGFKDMVKYRKKQGFNSVNILACFPNWFDDEYPERLEIDDKYRTVLRNAWVNPETGSAKEMKNDAGLPFAMPGIIKGYENAFPDVTKINPEYWRELDKKIDYLNSHGFTPFLETLRRDSTQAWYNYYPWPDSYVRYVTYIFARYQANSMIYSPMHFDAPVDSIHPREFNKVLDVIIDRYGIPPFGTLLSANAGPSTLSHFGESDEAPWITLHQIGNKREHEYYWYLTEIFNLEPPVPGLHGEPYYSTWGLNVDYFKLIGKPNTPEDDRYVRSGMYGSFLSGGLAGYIYGVSGLVRACREKGYGAMMWDGIQFKSAEMIQIFKDFVFSEGEKYQDLIPNADHVTPNKTHDYDAFEGWAYCARTKEKDLIMAYYEKGCPSERIRSVLYDGIYKASWYDPRCGKWIDAGIINADAEERILNLPKKPTDDDWCLKLVLQGQVDKTNTKRYRDLKIKE